MSNFAFLQSEWPLLYEAALKAEGAVHSDARTACFYARRTLELTVSWLYKHDKAFKLPYQDNLSALIHEPTFRSEVGEALFAKAKLIKDVGNLAVHSTRKIQSADAISAVRELFHLCYWLARTYGLKNRPSPALAFALDLLPPAAANAPTQSQAQLQKLESDLKASTEALSSVLSDKAAIDEELKALRAQLAAAKASNEAQPDAHDYSEAETRKAIIDVLLKEAGWNVDATANCEVPVQGMPNNEGIGYADYVFWADNGKPLLVIEAKRTTKSPNAGKQQVKLYADCLEQMHGQRPVIMYTNGYQHWLWDDATSPPREVQGFFKKDELELMIQRRASRKKLADAVINSSIVERYYQTRAIRRVSASFETDKQRKALLVMATGAGKTRTVIALADVLIRCNWVKRVLFLADRIALVNQAVGAFKKFLPESSPVNLVTEKTTEGRVYVSTYQTMMGLIDDATDGQRKFGVGHFDLIIIDEAHRSVYRKFGAIFDYFDSLLVGLTATPKDEIDHNTYGLFDLESGVPTDAYGLDEAVADKHLVAPVTISVPLKFQREGIKYSDLSEDEKDEWDALEWSEDGSIPTAVEAAAINQWLFNVDTVDKVLEHLMTSGLKVAGGDRLGKTIIFAKNNAHAEFIAERFDANYKQYNGHFARVITYKTEYAQSLIDDFSAKDKMPHIAISVDMLDTGIDVPEVVNLVFFKIVRAKSKFWQMIGRGTRLCVGLLGPELDKKEFYVFDYCQNLEFFSQNLPSAEAGGSEPLSTRLFKARLDVIAEIDRHLKLGSALVPAEQADGCLTLSALRQDVCGMLHGIVAAMNVDNFIVRPKRQAVDKFSQLDTWSTLDHDALDELNTSIAGLPSELTDEDEDAKRFDMLLLRAQLAILQATPFDGLREKIQRVAQLLEANESIPAIKAEIVFIAAVAGDEWWEGVTVPMLEIVRLRLRALVKLLPKGERKPIYTDFEDEVGEIKLIELPQVTSGLNMSKFKDKARQFLKAHEDHLSLQRLRRNQPLTPSDLVELEKMLLDAGGSQELIASAKEKSAGLGIFIRSLVGLDREAAVQAFGEFIDGTTASANQIEFIELIIQELTHNGVMDAARLYESPFVDVSPSGPDGLFPDAQVDTILSVLEEIRARAVA